MTCSNNCSHPGPRPPLYIVKFVAYICLLTALGLILGGCLQETSRDQSHRDDTGTQVKVERAENTPPEPSDEKSPAEPAQPAGEVLQLPVLKLSSASIHPGDFLVIYLEKLAEPDEVAAVSDLPVVPRFFPYGQGRVALLPVNYRTDPGKYSLQVQVNRKGQPFITFNETVGILSKKFPTQNLNITSSQQALRTAKLLEEDQVLVSRAKSVTQASPGWQGKFLQPVQGRISTEYGVIRYINGQESGRHAGLDIATPRGTPVQATNGGIVTLSRTLNVTGNTVIIDHGLDLFSSYSHLDSLLVEEGTIVKQGDVIGEVGSTGFSTGPHLHWTMSIGSVFVNPWLFLEKDPLA